MGLFSNIISAIGNAASDVGNFFDGGNDQKKKQQQQNNTPATNNSAVKLPTALQNNSAPGAVAPSVFNMPAQNHANLTAAPVDPNPQPPAQHASLFHDLTHNPVTNAVGDVAKPVASAAAGTALAAGRVGTGLVQGIADTPSLIVNADNFVNQKVLGTPGGDGNPFVNKVNAVTNDVNQPFNAVNKNLDLASQAFGQQGADIYKPAQIVGNVATVVPGAAELGANLLTKAGQGDRVATNVLSKIGGQSANRLNPLNLVRNTNEAAGAGEVANVADDTAPLENTPPETGTKQISEAPTNAPPEENAPPSAAPNAPESGVKPVTPPPAPTPLEADNTPAYLRTPTSGTPPPPVTVPPEVAAAQDAAQQTVNNTAENVPKPVAAPEASAPAISPAQAAAVQAAESPTQAAVDAVPALEKIVNDLSVPAYERVAAKNQLAELERANQTAQEQALGVGDNPAIDSPAYQRRGVQLPSEQPPSPAAINDGLNNNAADVVKDPQNADMVNQAFRNTGSSNPLSLVAHTLASTTDKGTIRDIIQKLVPDAKGNILNRAVNSVRGADNQADVLAALHEATSDSRTAVSELGKLSTADAPKPSEVTAPTEKPVLTSSAETKPTPTPTEKPTPTEPSTQSTPTNMVVNNKDVPTETAPAPKENTPAPPTDLERNPNAVGNLPDRQKLLSSKVQAIRNTNTESGTALADKIDAADARHTELRAGWMHDLKPVFDLSKSDFRDAWNIQEGKLNPDRASQSARDAAATLKSVMPDIQKTADKASVVEGNLGDSYMPHTFKGDKGGPTVNMPKGVNTSAKTYGNLEKERLTNAQNYEKTPNALMDYIDKTSQRVGQSENFGAKNETAQALLAKIGAEGGDQGTADEAFGRYMRSDFPNTTAFKVQRAASTAFSLARLPTAAVSHLGQTANTAVDAGISKTLAGWARYLSHNSKDADFVERTGLTNPQSLGHYQNDYTSVKGVASRFIAPGLRPVMKMNRSVTALAYRAYGNALAKAGNVAKLQDLGVKGEIGSKLTDAQELQVARGGVQKTMFSGSKAQTPIKAETTGGRLIGQYRTAYALPQTKFVINSVLKEAAKGNIAPLARYLTVSAGVGAGTLAAKNAITGRSQSKGSTAATIAGALGGIPGEMLAGGAQYGAKNVVGTVAGDIAPMAGEAVKVGTAIQNSLSSKNPTPIERYGLKLAPVVGGRLANKYTPYAPGTSKSQVAAGAKQSTPGIYQVKAKDGTARFATLDGKDMKNYSTLTDAQAAQAKNEFKYSSAGQKITSNNAQQALDKDNFIKSGQQEQSIHGMVYQSIGNGKVASMEQKDYDYKTADNAMRNAKTNNDLKGYASSATSLLGNINWQLKHATLTDSQRSTLENKATTTQNDLAKYKGYGGFTKGTSGKSLGAAVTLPAKSGGTGLTAGTAKYTAPSLAAYAPSTAKNGNPFVRSISSSSGVK